MANRTTQQNRCLHALFTQIATHCNSVGLDQKTVVTALEDYECPVTPQSIKEVWRAIQIALTGKDSTKDLTTSEVEQVYAVFSKFWSELTGEHFVWPSVQSMLEHYEQELAYPQHVTEQESSPS